MLIEGWVNIIGSIKTKIKDINNNGKINTKEVNEGENISLDAKEVT